MNQKILTNDEDLIFWCNNCKIPIIKKQEENLICPCCSNNLKYLTTDLRPVFPEERLLIELLLNKPLEFLKKSVWASNNRYYIDGEVITITVKNYKKYVIQDLIKNLKKFAFLNKYVYFIIY